MQALPIPMFSVIVPVYNHEAYLPAALDSILRQSCNDYEVVVVDDGSKDRSGQIADEYAAHHAQIHVIHQPNAGLADARNQGIARARGQWLALLDSDDLWYRQTLQNFAQCLTDHPEARLVYGYYNRLNPDGTIRLLSGDGRQTPATLSDLFQRMFLNPSCVCFHRELIDQVGAFDKSLRLNEDYDLFLKFGKQIQYYPVGQPTTLRRRHAGNLSRPQGWSRVLETRVLERFVDRFGGRELLDENLIRRRLGHMYYTAGRLYFGEHCFRQAAQVLRQSLTNHPTLKARSLLLLARMLSQTGRQDPRPQPEI